jgi:hypothetical protein
MPDKYEEQREDEAVNEANYLGPEELSIDLLLAYHRERDAYALVKRAEQHLLDCVTFWNQRDSELRELKELEGEEVN